MGIQVLKSGNIVNVNNITYANNQIVAVYSGNKLVWSKPDTASVSQTNNTAQS